MPSATPISELPDAVASFEQLWEGFGGRRPAVFLDYDGTLTPIVDDPAQATLAPATRSALSALSAHIPVAIVSGRDLDDVRGMVAVDDFAYAGSHGFDMRLVDDTREQYGTEFLDDLAAADTALRSRLGDIAGVHVERKGFAVAVHFRRAAQADTGRVAEIVHDVAERHPTLRVTGGKDIHELRPDIDWDKGHALRRFIDVLELDTSADVPLYIGDDLTDEDGFAAINAIGTSIVVAGERDRGTIAHYRLDDPDAVRVFLDRMRDRAEQWTT